MSFVDDLLARVEVTWTAAVQHRFVTELFDGTLPREVLADYLIQDYQFCDAFVALLGGAVATAPDLPARLPFAYQLGAFAGAENDYFTETFDALGVSQQLRGDPPLRPVTEDFIELMTAATRSRSYPHVLAVLVVAELLYRDWAHLDRPWPDAPYRGWVEVHHNPGFDAWVDRLVAELNANEPTDPAVRADVVALFTRATELELAFFDACYHP